MAVSAALAMPRAAAGQDPIINTWAGGGPPNGAVASSASLGSPNSVTRDSLGNHYIASSETRLIYRVDGAGLVSVFAGGGTREDDSANDHPGLEAALNRPSHVVWFEDGLFVVEPSRIRRIDTQTGLVSTVTGGGALPFTGGMRAIDAAACPSGLAISPTGDIYFTDICDQTIKRIDDGILTRVAGVPAASPGSLGGDGGPASQALFRRPSGLAVDPMTGDLAVLDQVYRSSEGARSVRRISAGADHIVTGAVDETIETAYEMGGMTAVAFFLGQILWAQTYEGPAFLWMLSSGQLRQVGGVDSMTEPPAPGLGDGLPATEARFGRITGMQALNLGDEILVADEGLHAVRLIAGGFELVTRIAGNASASLSGDSGAATDAQLFRPGGIGFTGAGHAIFVDQDGGRLRRVDATTGEISTLLTTMPDGSALRLLAMAVHPLTGHVYFANRGQLGQSDERIHALDPASGTVTVVAGTGRRTCSIDCEGGDPADDLGDYGPATNATFNTPTSLAFDGAGNLYVADLANHRVRRINAATGEVRTVAGTGVAGFSGDGLPATDAQLWDPWALALGHDGTLYIADRNKRIRTVTPGSVVDRIDTVVNGYDPRSMAVDTEGRLFFGAPWYGQVLVWDGSDVSVYVNASPFRGFSGDGGAAVDARMSTASGLTVAGGRLYIADYTNHRIRVVRPGGSAPDLVIAKTTTSTFRQGDSASYRLTATNNGTAPTRGAYTVTDVLPTGLEATDVSGDDWDCSASTTTTISCSSNAELQPGGVAAAITIDVTIGATTPASITNTARIAGGDDADPSNNKSSVTTPVTPTAPGLTIAVDPASVIGGDTARGTVTLTHPAPARGATVTLMSADPSATAPVAIRIAAGTTSRTFSVRTTPVASTTGPFSISATYGGATARAPLTVLQAEVSRVRVTPSRLIGGQAAEGRVTLNGAAPAGGAAVSLASANPSATVPVSVIVPAGATSATFAVATVPVATTQAPFAISATYNGVTRSGILTVRAPRIVSVVLSPPSVVGGGPSIGTVTLSGPAPPGGMAVTLQSSRTAVATVLPSVTVPEASTSATFDISTRPVAAATTATIAATAGGATQRGTLTVTP